MIYRILSVFRLDMIQYLQISMQISNLHMHVFIIMYGHNDSRTADTMVNADTMLLKVPRETF